MYNKYYYFLYLNYDSVCVSFLHKLIILEGITLLHMHISVVPSNLSCY
jgi:hypothetical protein